MSIEQQTTTGVRRFKPYPVYKHSGVAWLGEIPAHWTAKSLKRLARVVNGSTPKTDEAAYWNGEIPWATPEDLGKLAQRDLRETGRYLTQRGYQSCGTSLVPEGSLILSTRAPIGHLAIASVDLCTNQGCRSLVFRGASNREFFYFELGALRPVLESLGDGSTFKELSKQVLEDVSLADPPPPEQHAISAFLDRETARIDALVAKKERLIELLQEKRAALITRAVTKGLDPNVRMKGSGVEWLGEIPEHWVPKRLIRLTDPAAPIVYGILLPGPRLGEGIPYIGAGDVAMERLQIDSLPKTTPEIASQYPRSRVRSGEIVYAIRGSFGSVEIVPPELEGVNLSRDAARIAPRSDVAGRWLCWALRSGTSQTQFDFHELGATITGVNIRDLKRVVLPLPPLSQQLAIADWLDRKTGGIDALMRRIQEAIDQLGELRVALISAAVTGKIDVREEVA